MRDDRKRGSNTPSEGQSSSLLQRLRRWLTTPPPDERYLAEATDHADLERRVRTVERANRGPALVTFNH